MNSESRLILELWETVRDTILPQHRSDIALRWLTSFDEAGMATEREMADLVGEDKHLTEAFNILYEADAYDDSAEYDEEE